MMFRIILAFAVLTGVYSQVVRFGDCPEVDFVKDFDASKYVGKWYEIERYPLVFEFLGKCVTAEYSAIDENTIGVQNEQINSILGNKQTITGTAKFEGPANEGKLIVSFPNPIGESHGPYWVVDTDYENFAVVWACRQNGPLHSMSSWILARQSTPTDEVLNKAYDVIAKNKIDRSHYSRTDQTNC